MSTIKTHWELFPVRNLLQQQQRLSSVSNPQNMHRHLMT